jgi:hypothetical protein
MPQNHFIERVRASPRLPLILLVGGIIAALMVVLAINAPWKSADRH